MLFVIVSSILALCLTACGDNAEKKVETNAAEEMQTPTAKQPEPITNSNDRSANDVDNQSAQSAANSAAPAEATNPNADISQAAINTAHQTAAADNGSAEQTASVQNVEPAA